MVKHSRSKKNYGGKKHKMTMRKLPGKCCDISMHSIYKWYDGEFERIGWMILANARGMFDKTKAYIISLERLKMAIQQKIHNVVDIDKKNDLTIMLKNVNILIT